MSNNWPELRALVGAAPTPPSEELALLPCPFCGEAAHLREGVEMTRRMHYVSCSNFDCEPTGPFRPTAESAIAAWNTRPDADALRQQLADERAAHERTQTRLAHVIDEAGEWKRVARFHLRIHEYTRRDLYRVKTARVQTMLRANQLEQRLAAARDLLDSAECYLPGPLWAELLAALAGNKVE